MQVERYSAEWIRQATKNRKPSFDNLLKVLSGQRPDRYTLFEFFLNDPLEAELAGRTPDKSDDLDYFRCKTEAFRAAGYDYVTVHASDFRFHRNALRDRKASISANDGAIITNRAEYDAYVWDDPEDFYTGRIEKLAPYLPDGMKMMVPGPNGVLENVIDLIGFDNLCYMLADDPELVGMVFDQVGSRLLRYYRQVVDLDCVGVIMSNDDWGFNTQTMLSTADMRKYVFPWHKKITELAHQAGKPVVLHSCGNLSRVEDDLIDDMQYDGKHSYEDKICPVEEKYDQLSGRIAVLGGIDVDFVCRAPADDVYARCRAILEKTQCKGYALGTGNSVPAYLPNAQYYAMISAALS